MSGYGSGVYGAGAYGAGVPAVINPNWPRVITQVAFNAAPNDPAAVPTWIDLSDRCRALSAGRGRQYEIDQNQAGEADITFSDPDEALNPANGSGPFAPNLLPYRGILDQAMWPPTPLGAAVNLLNATSGYDPSFETTAVGDAPPNLLTYQATPTVQAGTAFTGSNALRWTVTGGGGPQYAGFLISCIPGQLYTASVYYRQTAANGGWLLINGGPGSATTTTTGAFVRLSMPFVATQPLHELYVGSAAPALGATVNVDAVQVEPGNSLNAFSTTGPVIYGVFRGYVERWPASWNHRGLYGMAEVTCVDALGVIAQTKLHTEFRNAVLATQPAYYWVLNEPSTATTFGEQSGNGGPPLVRVDASYGPASTVAPSTTANLPGDPSGVGVEISQALVSPQPGTVLQTGSINNTATVATPKLDIGSTPPFAYSVSVVTSRTVTPDGGMWVLIANADYTNRFAEIETDLFGDLAMTVGPVAVVSLGPDTTDVWADGRPHLYTITVDFAVTTGTVRGYVDGVFIGSNTFTSTSAAGWNLPITGVQIQIGGVIAEVSNGYWTNRIDPGVSAGVHSHVAVWRRLLSAAEITVLAQAAAGFPGESSGQRVLRYLGYAYTGQSFLDFGLSTMGVSVLAENQSLLDAAQSVAATENGNFYARGDGIVLFTSRERRYLNTTPKWVLGELESPYEADIKFDHDPSRVANTVKITRAGGGTFTAIDTASQQQYFERSFERTLNVSTDNEAADAAAYFLSIMKDPHQRVEKVTLKPSANPALWPVALGAEIGDRVTLKRRTSAGVTMSADFFIERVEHSRTADEWTVGLQMSPATAGSPWILEDATYGLLGVTTYLGY